MTLDTRIYLSGPIGGREAFELALTSILSVSGRSGERAAVVIEDTPCGTVPDWTEDAEARERWTTKHDQIATACGQGLPAWLQVYYREDGSPLSPEDDYDEDDGDRWLVRPSCTVEMSWDTAYGYIENGNGCSLLHAKALVDLAQHLPEGVSLRWKNEYSGDINDGITEAALADFLGSGAKAGAWFSEVALPAIMAEARGVSE